MAARLLVLMPRVISATYCTTLNTIYLMECKSVHHRLLPTHVLFYGTYSYEINGFCIKLIGVKRLESTVVFDLPHQLLAMHQRSTFAPYFRGKDEGESEV